VRVLYNSAVRIINRCCYGIITYAMRISSTRYRLVTCAKVHEDEPHEDESLSVLGFVMLLFAGGVMLSGLSNMLG